ncbi:hypothetical protein KC19_VG117200 [Ceratodon purpureus]|uniref:Uncharacterized protein n=1 Tax=Ceratodon purpureus TaxID=3225 RepID=A0A8T0HPD0_CERPU|nr:hypothetical protein KC19_VG117200 [Ceratodon purpureus]
MEVNETSGTPNHSTAAVVNRTKSDLVGRSLGRELGTVTTQLQSITKRMDDVERHMTKNDQDMAEVQKKLDLLLGFIMPTGAQRPPSADLYSFFLCNGGREHSLVPIEIVTIDIEGGRGNPMTGQQAAFGLLDNGETLRPLKRPYETSEEHLPLISSFQACLTYNSTWNYVTTGTKGVVKSLLAQKRKKTCGKAALPITSIGTWIRVIQDLKSVLDTVSIPRPTMNWKRPSKFLDYIPPSENKARAEGVSQNIFF